MLNDAAKSAAGDIGRTPCDAAVTVVFSTRNRAPALAPVLECFTRLASPAGGWKLLVVDNGSTDGTQDLLGSYLQRLPLTVLTESLAGKNRALNTALPYLEGALVVLTDDDVLPEADWLVRLQDAASAHPEAALFGGTVLPHWSTRRPAWLTETAVPFSVLYAQQKRPGGACRCDAIFGPNMAVRRSVFEAGLRFSETVGPDESRPVYAMGGETEFLRRAEAAGYTSWFVPEAVVGHIIRPEQLGEDWILRRGYRYGIGEGRHYAGNGAVVAMGRGAGSPAIPIRLRLRVLFYAIAAALIRLTPRSAMRLKIRYKAKTLSGTLEALRNLEPQGAAPSRQAAGVRAQPRAPHHENPLTLQGK